MRRLAPLLLLVALLVFTSAAAAADGTTITSPTSGASVRGQVPISATAPSGTTTVTFSWSANNGSTWTALGTDADGSDGWQSSLASAGYNGPALLRAVADGGATDTINVTVDNQAPVVQVSASPTYFSPNGDGRKDTTTAVVSTNEPLSVDVIVVSQATGATVKTLANNAFVDGGAAFAWGGHDASGDVAANGVYLIRVHAEDQAGNGDDAQDSVRLDTVRPTLSWSSSGGRVGASSVTVKFSTKDASGPLDARFHLANPYGWNARNWSKTLAVGAGSTSLSKSTVLATIPGAYRFTVVLTDAAGNRAALKRSPVYRLDHYKKTSLLYRFSDRGRRVALTFDDCNFGSSWTSILNTLDNYNVKAAFFCPGQQVQAHLSQAARTLRAGHVVGSHGWDHADMATLSYSSALWRLVQDRNVYWRWRAAATPYFRPPYGSYDSTVLSAASAAGYRYTVIWDVDPRDWSDPGSSVITSRVLSAARPGSIILLHVKPQTAAALPSIIRGLRSRDLNPTGLDRLVHKTY